jgi:hypothetical protein
VTLLNESSVTGRKLVQNIQIAKIDLSGCVTIFSYDLFVETVNSRGDRNSAVFLFTVDNTVPILSISEMPEAVKDREIFIPRFLYRILSQPGRGLRQQGPV